MLGKKTLTTIVLLCLSVILGVLIGLGVRKLIRAKATAPGTKELATKEGARSEQKTGEPEITIPNDSNAALDDIQKESEHEELNKAQDAPLQPEEPNKAQDAPLQPEEPNKAQDAPLQLGIKQSDQNENNNQETSSPSNTPQQSNQANSNDSKNPIQNKPEEQKIANPPQNLGNPLETQKANKSKSSLNVQSEKEDSNSTSDLEKRIAKQGPGKSAQLREPNTGDSEQDSKHQSKDVHESITGNSQS